MIEKEKWNSRGRYVDELNDLSFVQGLVGKRCKFMDVEEGHFYKGVVVSLYWDGEMHCLKLDIDPDSEEDWDELALCSICYLEVLSG